MKISQLRQIMQKMPVGADPQNATWRNEFIRQMGLNPGELYQELEMDSRFVDTHRDVSAAGTPVNLHSHSFAELLFCRSCEGVEYLVGAERYRLQKGDVVIVPAGVSHRPLLSEDMDQPYIRDVVWLSPEFTRQICRWFPELADRTLMYSTLLRTGEDVRGTLSILFDQGVREAESDSGDRELAVIGNTVTLLTQLHRAYTAQAAQPMKAEKPELLDRVMQYVEENLGRKIALGDVANHFFVSESTITQLFRKKMGVSFYHCVTQRRLIAAKALIGRNVPLESVSEQVGFTDYSAFYKAFKKEYGISPRQYRTLQETASRR